MANEKLLRFYSGEGTDDRDRTIADIWCYSHNELEGVHDYIQWLFPLAERSAFNPAAPQYADRRCRGNAARRTTRRRLHRRGRLGRERRADLSHGGERALAGSRRAELRLPGRLSSQSARGVALVLQTRGEGDRGSA